MNREKMTRYILDSSDRLALEDRKAVAKFLRHHGANMTETGAGIHVNLDKIDDISSIYYIVKAYMITSQDSFKYNFKQKSS